MSQQQEQVRGNWSGCTAILHTVMHGCYNPRSQITQSDSSSCICHRKSKCTLPDPPIFFSCLRNLVLPFPEIRRYIIPFRPLLRWKNDIICLLCFAHRYSHPPLLGHHQLLPNPFRHKTKTPLLRQRRRQNIL